ncbi:MAG TPA: biotin/lipoyl-containing protein, partial [Arenimonas sp.]|nr:biotin/lipoyl-containing protein [Arenimonas sp.]
YVNAGTVEFIVGADGSFYFMEINTRLQVEHPVTEQVTGLDLVEWQLRVAAGQALPLAQEAVQHRGHAIEVRLYAEDPAAGFLPGSGKLETLRLPSPSAHVRLDGGVVEGDTVTIFYDPMIAKLIVHDVDRPRALARLREALAECEIRGPKSNIEFLEKLVRHPVVVEGRIHTGYLDAHLDEVLPVPTPVDAVTLAAAATLALLQGEADTRDTARLGDDPHSPWAIADGWRHGHAGQQWLALRLRGDRIELAAHGHAGDYRIETPQAVVEVVGARVVDGRLSARFDGTALAFRGSADARGVFLHDGVHRFVFERLPAFQFEAASGGSGQNRVSAPMPGRIVAVKVAVGDAVAEGQEVLVMEAMKMELSLKAPHAGTVKELRAVVGEFVEADAVLAQLELA